MNRRDLLVLLILSVVLGIGVLIVLNGPGLFTLSQSMGTVATSPFITPTSRSVAASVSPTTTPGSYSIPTRVLPTATPTLVPVQVGMKKEEDLESVLLLYDSTQVSNFDINFCKIAEYYGLQCKKIALDTSALTEDLLRDSQGNMFKLIGIGAETLLGDRRLLKNKQIALLKSAVEAGGANLFVAKVNSQLKPDVLATLTDGAIAGVTKPQGGPFSHWSISTAAPEITREFTGQVISWTVSPKYEYALSLGRQDSVTTLITSTNAAGAVYPIFLEFKKGRGSIFVDSGEAVESLEQTPLSGRYGTYAFSQVIPLMMTVRYALGDRAWHSDHKYANLTIDDPALTEPSGHLNFAALLTEMELHNFHTTIAFVPAKYQESELSVVNLFLVHPDRFSLVQHGNNHDGYEFYKYTVSANDKPPGTSADSSYDPTNYTARPLAQQESDITQGLRRMAQHQNLTGIPFDQIMIFPYGISPEPTLTLLKKYNYLATVNGEDVPLEATRPSRWDYGMYPANMDYGNFPSLLRRHPGTFEPFRPDLSPFILDLFIGKPALFYSHEYELFKPGMDTFDQIADQMNQLPGGVEWRNLGYIIKHMYLEKTNSDGSVDVKMYGNDLIITPAAKAGATYHVMKEETLNVPIQQLTVNGREFPYRVEQGLLKLDVVAPVDGSPIEVVIRYAG